jgi:hypothetical protein
MTAETSPEELQARLQEALQAGDFAAAWRWSESLGSAIVEELRGTPMAKRAALQQQRVGLIQESLSLARVLRAHIASQLQINTAVFVYQEQPNARHCWRFDG